MPRLIFAILISFTAVAQAADGVVTVKSHYGVAETADRLEKIVTDKGMRVFARIDHAAGAKSIDSELRPTQLLIFGSPNLGTALMHCEQSLGLDLPIRVLVFENADGGVLAAYQEPAFLAKRYAVEGCAESFAKMEKALGGMVKAATE